MSLTPEESARYARHIVLKDIGGVGQQKIHAAKVVVVGAGGLGSPIIAALSAAGMGQITVVDPDTVSLSNLQRQFIHRTADKDSLKVESAARFATDLNPHVDMRPIVAKLEAANADALIAGHDLVVEGSDSFATRVVVAEACERAGVPLVTGAVGQFDGSLTVIAPHVAGNPRFSDLYPEPPSLQDSPPCELAGVLSVLPMIIGAMMANEVLKLITGFGPVLVGRLLMYSARSGETTLLRYGRR